MSEPASESFLIHVLQWRIEPGQIEYNLRRAEELLSSANLRHGAVVVMPEMFCTGFQYRSLDRAADRAPEVRSWMAERARQHGIHIAGSFAAKTNKGIVNRLAVFGPRGEEGSYDKVHLFPPTAEDQNFTAGDRMAEAVLDKVKAGLLICFDLRFPEASRVHAASGAGLLLVPAQWPFARADHFRLLARARAMENQLFVASANACGPDAAGMRMAGGSLIVDPFGDVLAEMGTEEGSASAPFSSARVAFVRRDFPTLSRRRPDAYWIDEKESAL